MTAREEIGRAVAEKIRDMEDPRYLRRFAQYVLPKVDKFLESPEEKRLRRLRSPDHARVWKIIRMKLACKTCSTGDTRRRNYDLSAKHRHHRDHRQLQVSLKLRVRQLLSTLLII